MKNYKTIIAMVAAGLACSTSAFASLVPIGVDQSQTGAALQTTSIGGGATLLDTVVSSLTGGGFLGTLTTKVFTADANNAFGGSGLTFEYALSLTSGKVGRITLDDFFSDTQIAVANVSGVASFSAQFNDDGSVAFSFSPDFQTSTVVIVDSALSGYNPTTALIQDGHQGSAQSLAPVPEPSTVVAGALMLLPFGLGAIRSLRKDRTA